MPTLQCVVENNVMPEHTDSLGMAWFDGKIHACGGAVQAVTPSNLHRVWDVNGNLLHSYAAPFTADAEAICSLIVSGKLTVFFNNATTAIWQFDPTIAGYAAGSWSQVTADYSGLIGDKTMCVGGDIAGEFYALGGWNGTQVHKTSNFTSWTLVGSLPANLARVSAAGFCIHGGILFIAGGASKVASPYSVVEFYAAENLGYLYSFDGTTFTLIMTDQQKFGQIWGDLCSDGTNLYYSKGYMGPDQVAAYAGAGTVRQGNQRGLLYSDDDGATWSSVASLLDGARFFCESHRRGPVNVNGVAYFVGGNFTDDIWKITA